MEQGKCELTDQNMETKLNFNKDAHSSKNSMLELDHQTEKTTHDEKMETLDSLAADSSITSIMDSKEHSELIENTTDQIMETTQESEKAESAETPSVADNLNNKRWNHLKKILEHDGPFCSESFVPTDPNLESIMQCKVLVIGAGGLGCELLKDLAMMGFQDIHCIDMDTIELSNLNRQFLFRRKDIGKSKAICAAAVINERILGCTVTPHFCKIQDYGSNFYRNFNVVVCGLDSIIARRWINGMLHSLIDYDDGMPIQSTIIPMVDGGAEGFKGSVRIILPGINACIECTLDLYPPQITYPLCTIANKPRLPEHCIEYVKIIQWDKENPFNNNAALDGDDPTHLSWVYEKAQERAASFNITGLTYRLVQGVLKNIIPAVASTNAVISAACTTEVFKLATNCYEYLNNNLLFNDVDGIYTQVFEIERKSDCIACSNVPKIVPVNDPNSMTLEDLIQYLCENAELQMKSPGLTAQINGKMKTLYMSRVKSIEERTRAHLTMSLTELGLEDGHDILVADQTTPNTIVIQLKYKDTNEVDM